MNSPIVETASGKVRGAIQYGVFTFKGIPYGADTGGANRFQPPKSISWSGVRDALDCGRVSPQIAPPYKTPHREWLRDTRKPGENCLVLNVFTRSIADMSRQPVMVYLHGGGFMFGSGGAPGIDGCNLARRDVVAVTVNHRLNLFGHLYLGDTDGGRYADSGNAGMLDCVAALEWVKRNISRFGGDPSNVTIVGQSGGGSKVATLMAMPQAKGMFHKAIVQSASSLLAVATREEAERNTYHFLRQLALHRSNLRELHQIPAEKLLRAMTSAMKAAGQIDNYRPVVEGRVLPCQPFERTALELSAGVPLVTGWCENEQRLAFADTPGIYKQSAQQARASVANVLSIQEDEAAKLIAVYHSSRPQDTQGDIFTQIVGDHRYRRSVTHAAELHRANRTAPVYVYLLNWKTPVLDGLLRTPHTLCIPFIFGNVDVATGIVGTGADRYSLQEEMAGAWVAFASNGNPNHAGLPRWRPFSVGHRPTMVFGRQTELVNDPLREERLALEPLPRYIPAIWEGRRTW